MATGIIVTSVFYTLPLWIGFEVLALCKGPTISDWHRKDEVKWTQLEDSRKQESQGIEFKLIVIN